MKKISILSICTAAIMFAACNSSTTTDNTDDSTNLNTTDTSTGMFNDNDNSDNADINFIEEATKGNLVEVELGKIAVEKATRQDVKDFAQMMVDDHSKANSELLSIAQSKNVTVPTALTDAQRGDIKDLTDKTGADFDKAYVDKMVDDHKNDIDKYQSAVNDLQDSTVKNYAIKTLPVLQQHYDQIQKIQALIK